MTREEAKERLQKIRHEYTFNSNKEATQNLKALDMAIEALSVAVSREDTVTLNSPISIQADMVAVVRCKDCVYKQYDVTHNFCEINYHKCYDDDFCSWGERREP